MRAESLKERERKATAYINPLLYLKDVPECSTFNIYREIEKLKAPSLVYRCTRDDMIEVFKMITGKYDNKMHAWTEALFCGCFSSVSRPRDYAPLLPEIMVADYWQFSVKALRRPQQTTSGEHLARARSSYSSVIGKNDVCTIDIIPTTERLKCVKQVAMDFIID